MPPTYPAFGLLFCPLSPQPPSPTGKGENITLFRRGLRPRHPCIKPFAALTELAKQMPDGGKKPTVQRKTDRKRLRMSGAGSQGEGGPGERNFGV